MILLVIPVRLLLVLTVKGNGGSGSHFAALGVVLNDLPVLLDGNVDITELDLTLLTLLNLSKLLPLERQNETVTASRVNVGNDPNVLQIGGNDLLEGLESQFLLIGPLARGLLSLKVGLGKGLGDESNVTGTLFDDIFGVNLTGHKKILVFFRQVNQSNSWLDFLSQCWRKKRGQEGYSEESSHYYECFLTPASDMLLFKSINL